MIRFIPLLFILSILLGCSSVAPPESLLLPSDSSMAHPSPSYDRVVIPSIDIDTDTRVFLEQLYTECREGVAIIDRGELDAAWEWVRFITAKIDEYLEKYGDEYLENNETTEVEPTQQDPDIQAVINRARDSEREELDE